MTVALTHTSIEWYLIAAKANNRGFHSLAYAILSNLYLREHNAAQDLVPTTIVLQDADVVFCQLVDKY